MPLKHHSGRTFAYSFHTNDDLRALIHSQIMDRLGWNLASELMSSENIGV